MSNCRKVKTDDSGNPLQITIKNSANVRAEEVSEIITIDDSFNEIEDDSTFKEPINLADMDTTVVNFDATLPPGVAPEGFVILDEAINTSKVEENESNSQSELKPLFKVVFRDKSAVRKYKHKIEEFYRKLITGKRSTKFSDTELILNVYDFELNEKKSKNKTQSTNNEISKENQLNDSLFTVDTLPKIQDILDIPVYGKKFNKALEVTKKKEIKEDDHKDDCAPKLTCFNCMGNHSLRDCEEPRNFNAINKNRKDFMSRKGPSSNRYHLEDDQRFGHFQPGIISSKLRKALGLKENEIPRHIYRMRNLGYPPGWMEEARQQHSGLSLFNSDGLAEAGCSDEEGEIIAPGDKDKYDINKLIDFPGFNVTTPPGFRDECKAYWGSTQQQSQSKELMLSQLSKKKAKEGYTRKKLPNPAQLKISQNVNSGEMEIDEVEDTSLECVPIQDVFIPPLPKETLDCPPPPPPNESDDSDEPSQDTQSPGSDGEIIEISPVSSPSLRDLETKKNLLLAALYETSSTSNLDTSNKSDIQETSTTKENSDNTTPQTNRILSFTEKEKISVAVGTPVIKSISPFSKLPCPEKFSKNICDVINFENLPDSTGKYDQMIGVLQKVRSTLAELNKD